MSNTSKNTKLSADGTSESVATSASPFSRSQAEAYQKRRKRVFRKQIVVRTLLCTLAAVFVAALVGVGIWYASVQA